MTHLDFLQTIMFTLFGNFEVREEHLLLTMFEHALGLEFAHAKDMGRFVLLFLVPKQLILV